MRPRPAIAFLDARVPSHVDGRRALDERDALVELREDSLSCGLRSKLELATYPVVGCAEDDKEGTCLPDLMTLGKRKLAGNMRPHAVHDLDASNERFRRDRGKQRLGKLRREMAFGSADFELPVDGGREIVVKRRNSVRSTARCDDQGHERRVGLAEIGDELHRAVPLNREAGMIERSQPPPLLAVACVLVDRYERARVAAENLGKSDKHRSRRLVGHFERNVGDCEMCAGCRKSGRVLEGVGRDDDVVVSGRDSIAECARVGDLERDVVCTGSRCDLGRPAHGDPTRVDARDLGVREELGDKTGENADIASEVEDAFGSGRVPALEPAHDAPKKNTPEVTRDIECEPEIGILEVVDALRFLPGRRGINLLDGVIKRLADSFGNWAVRRPKSGPESLVGRAGFRQASARDKRRDSICAGYESDIHNVPLWKFVGTRRLADRETILPRLLRRRHPCGNRRVRLRAHCVPRPKAIEYIRRVKQARPSSAAPDRHDSTAPVARSLVVKRNRLEREARCTGCGAGVAMRVDEVLIFAEGTWDVVCEACAAATDPALVHLVSFGRAATSYAKDIAKGPAWVSDEPAYSAMPGRDIEIPVHHYKGARKPWVTRLLARDRRYKFERHYLETVPMRIDPSGQFGDYVARVRVPGVYQIGDAGDRTGYWLCWAEDRGLRMGKITEERAGAIVDLVTKGVDVAEAQRRTRPRLEGLGIHPGA